MRGRDLVRQMLTLHKKGRAGEETGTAVTGIVKETVKLLRATTPATINIKLGA